MKINKKSSNKENIYSGKQKLFPKKKKSNFGHVGIFSNEKFFVPNLP